MVLQLVLLIDIFFRKICKNFSLKTTKSSYKTCVLANGSQVSLQEQVTLPIRFKYVTIDANFYILPMSHTQLTIILGCDLLSLLHAKIDFHKKQLILQSESTHTLPCIQQNTLGQLELKHERPEPSTIHTKTVNLKEKLHKINLPDINVTQQQELIKLLNSYEDIFANDLHEIGRTNILEYDIEIPLDQKPIRQPQYKYAYKYRNLINTEVKK